MPADDEPCWHLPVFRHGLAAILREVEIGRHLVIDGEGQMPVDVRQYVSQMIRDRLGYGVTVINVDEAQPLQGFQEWLGDDRALESRAALVESLRGYRRVLWVEPGSGWTQWRDLLVNWEQALRAQPVDERCTVIAVPPQGSTMPTSDVAMAVIRFAPVLDPNQLHWWYASQYHCDGWHVGLKVSMAAHVAVWDREIMLHLCRKAGGWEQWSQFLRDQAVERGWHQQDTIPSTAICKGSVHPCWAALQGNHDEVLRRIWSAQVSVLMPRLENDRCTLIRRWGGCINRRVLVDEQGNQRDVESCEFGFLRHLIQLGAWTPPRPIAGLVFRCADMRNSLAHRRPVSTRLIEQYRQMTVT